MHLIEGKVESLSAERFVCFGAGQALHSFIQKNSDLGIASRISAVVDSKASSEISEIALGEYIVPFFSFKAFSEASELHNCTFVITSTFLKSILTQCEEIPLFENKECYYYGTLLLREDYYTEPLPKSLKLNKHRLIPQKIHYCWFGGNEKSDLNKKCIESWKLTCPEFEIVEWNESNYDIHKHPFLKKAYDSGMWAYVSDYARLDIIYHYGGIYLDTDVEVLRNLDPLLYQDAFMGIDASKRISLGLGFGAVAGKKEIADMMGIYNDKDFNMKKALSTELVIPEITKSYFEALGYMQNGKYQVINNITVYPERVLSGFDGIIGMLRHSPETYMAHHYEGSWASTERRERIRENWAMLRKIETLKNESRDEHEY